MVSDFKATAVAALGAEEPVVAFGGAVEPAGVAAGGDGRHEPPVGTSGLGATDDAPGAMDGVPVVAGLGATNGVPGAGATDVVGFGAVDEVAGGGGTDAAAAEMAGFGATDVLAGAAALGARDGVGAAGLAKGAGAGIEVSPVAGPGPGGGGGCTGIVVEGAGGASSRQARASASKLRSVLRPQMGQSHPTSNRFSWASMVCAGARSRMRSRPIAKPEST